MADFKISFAVTMGHEGGYSNRKNDRGGETYRGVSRKYFPEWGGWKILDSVSVKDDKELIKNNTLNTLVEDFYRKEFWNTFQGDKIPSQTIANELFDTGVNIGVRKGVEFLQLALNVLNRNKNLFADMTADGIFGINTLVNLKTYLKTDTDVLLYKVMNILQGQHFIAIMLKDGTQEENARGWFTRVEIYKGK